MQEQNFRSVVIAPCCFLEKRTSNFLKWLCQLFFAMTWLAASCMCEDMSIKMLPIPHCQYHIGRLLAFRETAIKALKQGVKFVQA